MKLQIRFADQIFEFNKPFRCQFSKKLRNENYLKSEFSKNFDHSMILLELKISLNSKMISLQFLAK